MMSSTSTPTTSTNNSTSSFSLPTECRPLLIRTAMNNNNYSSSSDDSENDNDDRHHSSSNLKKQRKSRVSFIKQQQQQQQSSSSSSTAISTDWLSIARHTLQDISSSLPVARNNELRLKTTSATITKIEEARQLEQEPSLHAERYRLPQQKGNNLKTNNLASDHYLGGGQNQSVYEEAVRVRNTLEIVASRIRDAIACDVKNRLYNKQKDMFMNQKSRRLEQEQAEQIRTLQSDVSSLQNKNTSLKEDLDSTRRHAADEMKMKEDEFQQKEISLTTERDLLQRELNDARFRKDFQELIDNQEMEQRHLIEVEFLENLLLMVLEQHQAIYALERSATEQASNERHQRQLQDEEDAKQREFEKTIEEKEREFVDRSFDQKLSGLLQHEEETRQVISSLALSEFDFLSTYFSEETEIIIERSRQQEQIIANVRESERKHFTSRLDDSIQQLKDENLSSSTSSQVTLQLLQLENELEPSFRQLITNWEHDQFNSLLAHQQQVFIEIQSKMTATYSSSVSITQTTQLHKQQLNDATCRSKYFHIWSCWALFKREENYRLDRERHRRIVESATLLQQSQMENCLTPLMMNDYSSNNTSIVSEEETHYFNRLTSEDEQRRRLLFEEEEEEEVNNGTIPTRKRGSAAASLRSSRQQHRSVSPVPSEYMMMWSHQEHQYQYQQQSPSVRRV